MAKKNGSGLHTAVSFLMWLTGIIVALAVGFAMTGGGPLSSIPYLSAAVTGFFGWVVVATTVLGVILAIIHYFR